MPSDGSNERKRHMRIFATGATGLVGPRLVERLLARGDQVVVLTRRPELARTKWGERVAVVAGDPNEPGPWQDAIADCDAVVHLAGEGIFNRRWNATFKERLRTSRLQGTANVVAALARHPRTSAGTPKVLASASAIGYYGPHGDEELTEATPPGDDFLARLCVEWERAARAATDHGVRVVLLRFGIILDPSGGALAKLLTPFKLFVGGPVGSGRQVMSWIHGDDVVGLILFALDTAAANGPLNVTAPAPVTNRQFGHALGRVLHRPSFLPTPAFALRLMLGESAHIVTTGQRVLPRQAQELGYRFQFAQLDAALRDLLGAKA